MRQELMVGRFQTTRENKLDYSVRDSVDADRRYEQFRRRGLAGDVPHKQRAIFFCDLREKIIVSMNCVIGAAAGEVGETPKTSPWLREINRARPSLQIFGNKYQHTLG